MQKRRSLTIRNISFFEIFLLVSVAFAISFILDENNVSANHAPDHIGEGVGEGQRETLRRSAGDRPSPLQNPNGGGPGAAAGSALIAVDKNGNPVDLTKIANKNSLNVVTPKGVSNFQYSIPEAQKGFLVEGQTAFSNEVVTRVVPQADGGAVVHFKDGGTRTLTKAGYEDLQGKLTSAGGNLQGPKQLDILGLQITGGWAHLFEGVLFAGIAVGAIQLIGGLFGADKQILNSLSIGAFGGIMTWRGLTSLGPSGFNKLGAENFLVKNAGLIGIGVGIALFVLLYKKESKKTVTLTCMPWEPPIGGSKCEECNKDPFRPCSEYRCKSLGQACELVNKGTDKELCTWVNRGDVNSPTIEPWDEALKPTNLGLVYVDDKAIRPPSRGVKIVKSGVQNGCLPAFTPLEFGIINNEPAQCKIDYNRNATFEEMQFFFGEVPYFQYNHTEKIRLPGPDTVRGGANASLSPILNNDGSFSLYVKCQDANGNKNEADAFVFNYCVDPGPDTTPPIMEGFSIVDGSPVQFSVGKVPIELYVNEPAECKWSRQNKVYEDMENVLSCNKESFQINADLSYTCSGELTGIKDREDNKFYFRCKDQPDAAENERNVNVQSKELTLKGSQPLNILSVGPNATIYGTADVVPVTLKIVTDDGAEEGKAICYFATQNVSDSFIAMFNTNNFEHSQPLDLTAGSYTYYFRCIDAGGNAAESQTSFTVFLDRTAPRVTRIYHDSLDSALKVVTDEDASCTYSIQSCNFVFDEGIDLIYSNPLIQNVHFAEWKETQSYYIKCKDEFGNEPSPNACSVVAKASQL